MKQNQKQSKALKILSAYDLLKELVEEVSRQGLEKLVHIIPEALMFELKSAADMKNISLAVEVVTRLVATLIEPRAFGINSEVAALLRKKPDSKQARIESEYRRIRWLYLFEMEKLKLWVEFEQRVPKNYKESFVCINVKKEIKAVRAAKTLRDQERDSYN